VGPRAQVRDLAQELQRMWLRLDGVGLRVLDTADDLDPAGLDLEALALALRLDQLAAGNHLAACGQAIDLGLVVGQAGGRNHLDRRETGAVADIDEAQSGLGIPPGTHPAPDRHLAADRQPAGKRVLHADHRHALNLALPGPIWERPEFNRGRVRRRTPPVQSLHRRRAVQWPSTSLPPPPTASSVSWRRNRMPW